MNTATVKLWHDGDGSALLSTRQLVALGLVICLPVPALAASGLTLPLPSSAYRLAAELVAGTEALATSARHTHVSDSSVTGRSGTIVLSKNERGALIVRTEPPVATPISPLRGTPAVQRTRIEERAIQRVESSIPTPPVTHILIGHSVLSGTAPTAPSSTGPQTSSTAPPDTAGPPAGTEATDVKESTAGGDSASAVTSAPGTASPGSTTNATSIPTNPTSIPLGTSNNAGGNSNANANPTPDTSNAGGNSIGNGSTGGTSGAGAGADTNGSGGSPATGTSNAGSNGNGNPPATSNAGGNGNANGGASPALSNAGGKGNAGGNPHSGK